MSVNVDDFSIKETFIPFSQSRNKGEKLESLNWKVDIFYKSSFVMTVDYMQGQAHCPSYKWKDSYIRRKGISFECESGFKARLGIGDRPYPTKTKIKPDTMDLLYCVVQDSKVVESGGFEDWCNDYGFSSDSIKAKGIYDDCMKSSLALVARVGLENMPKLFALFEDY